MGACLGTSSGAQPAGYNGYGQAGRPATFGPPQYGNSYGATPAGQYDGKPSYTQQNGGYTPQQGSATAGKPGTEDLKTGAATGYPAQGGAGGYPPYGQQQYGQQAYGQYPPYGGAQYPPYGGQYGGYPPAGAVAPGRSRVGGGMSGGTGLAMGLGGGLLGGVLLGDALGGGGDGGGGCGGGCGGGGGGCGGGCGG